ncbi:prepilin-type N-terminal cleavage/methylation domain-containing protein [Patescibacteria group bacterium]|nr:prepilin-type N-terminal cleavage/methylation domain-containing protein [Patescibacteria group bacterium]
MFNFNKNKKLGFTLLESLFAIMIFSMAILGPLALAINSIRFVKFSQNQITASFLAQESAEFVEHVLNVNKSTGADWLQELNDCMGAGGCYMDVWAGTIGSAITACPVGGCPLVKYNSSNGYYDYGALSDDTIFFRKVQITEIVDDQEVKVVVTINWQERLFIKTFSIERYLYY